MIVNVLSVSEGECNCEVTYADLDSLVEQTISDSAFIQDYYKLNETQSSETASKDLICDYLTVAIGNANVKKIDTQIVISDGGIQSDKPIVNAIGDDVDSVIKTIEGIKISPHTHNKHKYMDLLRCPKLYSILILVCI